MGRIARAIEILIAITILLFFISNGVTFVFGGPKNTVACKATNFPTIIVHRNEDGKTAKEEEVEDWRVTCTLTVGEKKLFDDVLTLAHPTSYEEAMLAIKEFRTKVAPKLIKENQK